MEYNSIVFEFLESGFPAVYGAHYQIVLIWNLMANPMLPCPVWGSFLIDDIAPSSKAYQERQRWRSGNPDYENLKPSIRISCLLD